MKTMRSYHECVFCHEHKQEINHANSTDEDIELIVNGKYILTFPGMLLHYLDPDAAKKHGWPGTWNPPSWLVHALLKGDVSIQIPPTVFESASFPTYKIGYLTTKKAITDQFHGSPPEAFKLAESKVSDTAVVDTQGGDINFINSEAVVLGGLDEKIRKALHSRFDTLITLARKEYFSRDGDTKKTGTTLKVHDTSDSKIMVDKTKKNDPHHWVVTLQDSGLIPVAIEKIEPPPKKKESISFESYVKATVYADWVKVNDVGAITQTAIIKSKKHPEEARELYISYYRYLLVSQMRWTIDEESGTATAEIDFSKLNPNPNPAIINNLMPKAVWESGVREVFKQLNIHIISLDANKVTVSLESLRRIEKIGVDISKPPEEKREPPEELPIENQFLQAIQEKKFEIANKYVNTRQELAVTTGTQALSILVECKETPPKAAKQLTRTLLEKRADPTTIDLSGREDSAVAVIIKHAKQQRMFLTALDHCHFEEAIQLLNDDMVKVIGSKALSILAELKKPCHGKSIELTHLLLGKGAKFSGQFPREGNEIIDMIKEMQKKAFLAALEAGNVQEAHSYLDLDKDGYLAKTVGMQALPYILAQIKFKEEIIESDEGIRSNKRVFEIVRVTLLERMIEILLDYGVKPFCEIPNELENDAVKKLKQAKEKMFFEILETNNFTEAVQYLDTQLADMFGGEVLSTLAELKEPSKEAIDFAKALLEKGVDPTRANLPKGDTEITRMIKEARETQDQEMQATKKSGGQLTV